MQKLMLILSIAGLALAGCSEGNVEIDHLRLVEQSDDLRRAGRCTSKAFAPRQDTHFCGMPAAHAYSVEIDLRTKSTGQVETSTRFMNKCEEHYMDANAVASEIRRMYAGMQPHSRVEVVSIAVKVDPHDRD